MNQDFDELIKPCLTPESLRHWLLTYLKLSFADQPVCPGHSSPFDYLWRAYNEPATDLTVWAPRGGGKTRLAAAATLLDLLHKPGSSVRILGGSMEQSLKMWEHLLPDLERLTPHIESARRNGRRVNLMDGSSVAALPQSQRAVRGLRVQKLRCDEVDHFDRDVWSAAQLVTKSLPPSFRGGPTGRVPLPIIGTVEAFSTCHRPGGLMSDLVEKAAKNGTLIKWCLMEVLEHCPKDRNCDTCPLLPECGRRAKTMCNGFFSIDDAIAMKQRVSKEMWETEMLCQRPSATGAVFPTFDPAIHVRQEPPLSNEPRPSGSGMPWLGIDFGFWNPFVCLWIQRDEEDRIFVIDEYVQSGRTMDDHVREMDARTWGKPHHIACDPAGASRNDQTAASNIALLKAQGYKVHSKGSRIIDGLERIRAALKTGAGETRLFIHPRCTRLIAAMKAYAYPENGGEIPFKDGTHDHLIDALRYYFVNYTRGQGTGSGSY